MLASTSFASSSWRSRSGGQLGMAEEAVRVEVDLAVEGHDVALLRHDQRVDLEQRAIELDVHLGEIDEERRGLGLLARADADAAHELLRFLRREALPGREGRLDDLLRVLGSDLLDLHAALGGDHHHRPLLLAVDGDADVVLLRDRGALLDPQAAHDLSVRAGLVGHQRLPQERRRGRLGLLERLAQLHAARLAAPAGVDLCLDHDERRLELAPGLLDVGDALALAPLGHAHAELLEQLLGLELVDLHRGARRALGTKRGAESTVARGLRPPSRALARPLPGWSTVRPR